MSTISFVGLGAMGLPMAKNLLNRGFALRGFDLNPKALATIEASGGVAATSARDAVAGEIGRAHV